MKLHPHPPDALVVGAGPVGLFTALTLTRRHIPVRLIDQAPGPGVYSYALALHGSTLDLLDHYGLTHSILRFALPIRRIAVYVEHVRVSELDLGVLPGDNRFLAVIPQSALESILIEALAREGVVVEWNSRLASLHLEPDQITGTIDGRAQRMMGYATTHLEWMVEQTRPFHVPFLIGADGFESPTRQMAHIPFERTAPAMDFAVFEFETREPIEPELKLVFVGDTVNACWPLSPFRCRWSFQVPTRSGVVDTREKERSFMQEGNRQYQLVNAERIRDLMAARAPFFTPSVTRVDWRMLVRFDPSLAAYMTEGNLCLVGDSAHVTGPAGMQSMNAGLLEAEQLTRALAEIIQDGATHEVLENWSLETRASWVDQNRDARHRGPLGTGDPRLARHYSALIDSLPARGDALATLLRQMGLHLPSAERQSDLTRSPA